jgi:four helix bundle protein
VRDLGNSRVLGNAKRLTRSVYELSNQLPGSERFGLVSQMQRASVSIAANIAEGLGRGSPGDLERFLRIASGSAAELTVLLELAKGIHDLSDPAIDDALDHVRRQLTALTRQVHAGRS